MNVASRELCEELEKLSGWKDSEFLHAEHRIKPVWRFDGDFRNIAESKNDISAYDLGYLLRKLPDRTTMHKGKSGYGVETRWKRTGPTVGSSSIDSPEDAACKLAIELFKQTILTREG